MVKNDNEQARNSGPGVGSNLARNGGLSYLEIPAVDAPSRRLSARKSSAGSYADTTPMIPGSRMPLDTSSAAG